MHIRAKVYKRTDGLNINAITKRGEIIRHAIL